MKFGFEFWAKIAEVIGFMLAGFSFIGRDNIGVTYSYLIGFGVFTMLTCLIMMIVSEFQKK